MKLLSIIKSNLFPVILIFCLISPISGKSSDYYYKKGKLQFQSEMYDYARYNLEKSLDLNPGLYQAAALLGHIHIRQNRKLRAIELCERSLSINSRQADVHVTTGELYDFYFEREKAMGHYRAAVAIEPGHIRANLLLAGHYFRLGMRKDAEKHFTASNRTAEARAGGFIIKAREAEKRGDTDTALRLYTMAMDAGPSLISAYMGHYRILRARADYVKAVSYLESLKKVRPDHARTYVILGHIYFNRPMPGNRINRINMAVKNLKGALEINPKNQEALMKLAEIYEYLGRDREASELLKNTEFKNSTSLPDS